MFSNYRDLTRFLHYPLKFDREYFTQVLLQIELKNEEH